MIINGVMNLVANSQKKVDKINFLINNRRINVIKKYPLLTNGGIYILKYNNMKIFYIIIDLFFYFFQLKNQPFFNSFD